MRKEWIFASQVEGAGGADPDAFIMTFALGASDSITLPLIISGSYNFTVDWGDGTSDLITAYNQAERIHSYSGQPAGDYVVTITGTCTAWVFASVTTSRTKLKTIDQWGDTSFTNLVSGFFGCSNLISIPTGLRIGGASQSVQNLFLGCSNLTAIPSGLFDLLSNLTIAADCFSGCSGVSSIPSGLFDFAVNLSNFSSTFNNCTGITSLPSGLLDNCTAIISIQNSFRNTRITSIPTDFLRYCTALTNVNGAFSANPSLTAIPSGCFTFNVNITNFGSCFFSCTGITSIPSGLFDTNTSATSFLATFASCPIASLPSGLFTNNNAVTSIQQCFSGGAFSSIPSGFLDTLTALTDCAFAFRNNNSLTSIPTSLFNNNTSVIAYNSCFFGCSNLAVSVSALVSGMTMTSVTTTNQMFSGCTSLTGNGQDLIDKPKAGGYTVGTGSGTGSYRTFFNCTALTDFATIPADYK